MKILKLVVNNKKLVAYLATSFAKMLKSFEESHGILLKEIDRLENERVSELTKIDNAILKLQEKKVKLLDDSDARLQELSKDAYEINNFTHKLKELSDIKDAEKEVGV
ncbi:MAG: hypothetical protein ACRC6E_14430 [Fusobacteriaceae bacterium]